MRWSSLEGNPVAVENVKQIPREILEAKQEPPKYPSSSKKTKDWDKLEKEIEKEEEQEKPEGDAALNGLFQKIYGTATDDVRRAMNKSFVSI